MKQINNFYSIFIGVLIFTQASYAVEITPRISDREIIESLAELKAGQKALNQRFDQQNQSINQRFEHQNQSINQRFEDMDKRFDQIWNLMLVIITGIFGLIGFIVWDRKTALRPNKTMG